MISKEEWVDWKRHPVTQEFLKALTENRYDRMEEIADGRVVGDDLLLEIGRTQGIKDCVELAVKNFPIMEINSGSEGGSVSSDSEG